MNTKKLPYLFAFVVLIIVTAIGFAAMIVGLRGYLSNPPAQGAPREPAPRIREVTVERTDEIAEGATIYTNDPHARILGFSINNNSTTTDVHVRFAWFLPTASGTIQTMDRFDSVTMIDDDTGMVLGQEIIPHIPSSTQIGSQPVTDFFIPLGSKKSIWMTADLNASGTLQVALSGIYATDANNQTMTVYRLPQNDPLSWNRPIKSSVLKVVSR